MLSVNKNKLLATFFYFFILINITSCGGGGGEGGGLSSGSGSTNNKEDETEKLYVNAGIDRAGSTTKKINQPGSESILFVTGHAVDGVIWSWSVVESVQNSIYRLTSPDTNTTGFYANLPGKYKLQLKVSDKQNNVGSDSLTIVLKNDLDGDSIEDELDPDIDGDGFLNEDDLFPNNKVSHLDFDGDGVGNYYSEDVDNDGFSDFTDANPIDSSITEKNIFLENKENTLSNQNDGISVSEKAGTTPIQINGTIYSEGNKTDIDYYQVLFKNTGLYTIYLESPTKFTPILAIMDNNGNPIHFIYSDLEFEKGKSAISASISQEGYYYVSVVESSGSSNNDWKYSIHIFEDDDFDCVDSNLEKAIDSNHLNGDSDGDGISDYYEIFNTKQNEYIEKDMDLDNIPDWWDFDSDDDGLSDTVEFYSPKDSEFLNSNENINFNDVDNDSIPNYLDTDSDGNNINDYDEAGIDYTSPIDTDFDRIPDYLDIDDDNDGLLDINDEYRLTPLNYSDIFIQEIFNTDKDIANVFSPGDHAIIKNENLEISNTYIIIQALDLFLNIEAEKGNDKLTFTWPENIQHGIVKVSVAFENNKTNAIDVLISDHATPILKTYSLDLQRKTISFFGYNLDKSMNVVFQNDSIYLDNSENDSDSFSCDIPDNGKTGYVYVNTGSGSSNMIWVNLLRSVTGQVIVPKNTKIDMKDLIISWSILSDDIPPDENGNFTTNIDISRPTIVSALLVDNSYESPVYTTFSQTIALKEDSDLILDARNCAVAMVWSSYGISEIVDDSLLKEVKNEIIQLEEIIYLANLIEEKQIINPYMFNSNDADIKNASEQALTSVSELINTKYSYRNKKKSVTTKGKFGSDAKVTPASTDDIDVYERDDTGNITIENDTQLYMSAKIISSDGKILKDHITGLSNMMSPQGYGLLFWASKTPFDVPNGENCTVEVITAGFGKKFDPIELESKYEQVYRWLIIRTVVERILWPALSTVVGNFNPGDFASILIANTPNIVSITDEFVHGNTKKGVTSLLNVFWQDIASIPPGPITQALAKRLGKDFAEKALAKLAAKIGAKFVPGVGQIALAIEIVGYINDGANVTKAIWDISSIDRVIRFEVKFPLQIESIQPNKIIADQKNKTFLINGSGFSPISRWSWLKRYSIYPHITLTDQNGKIILLESKNIDQNGTKMSIDVPGSFFKDISGPIKISVNHPHDNKEAVTEKNPAIFIISDIEISSVEPDKGIPGSQATIYGAGFSSIYIDNDVKLGDYTPIIRDATENSLSIVVPHDVQPESYNLKVRSRVDGVWSKWSNEVVFTVTEGKIKFILCDNGNRKDDAYAFYVDGKLEGTLYSKTSLFCKTFNLNLPVGDHFAMLLGLEAPDSIGTFNVQTIGINNVSGDPLTGRDLVPGVKKSYYFSVDNSINTHEVIKPFEYKPEFDLTENYY